MVLSTLPRVNEALRMAVFGHASVPLLIHKRSRFFTQSIQSIVLTARFCLVILLQLGLFCMSSLLSKQNDAPQVDWYGWISNFREENGKSYGDCPWVPSDSFVPLFQQAEILYDCVFILLGIYDLYLPVSRINDPVLFFYEIRCLPSRATNPLSHVLCPARFDIHNGELGSTCWSHFKAVLSEYWKWRSPS